MGVVRERAPEVGGLESRENNKPHVLLCSVYFRIRITLGGVRDTLFEDAKNGVMSLFISVSVFF